MSETFDAAVIGSGLGAATAGALYAKAGHSVLMLERMESFGGAASRFIREGQVFETALHETTAPRDGDVKEEVFRALDLFDRVTFVPVPELHEVRATALGAPFTLPHGYDAIAAAVADRFPQHAGAVRAFLDDLEHIRHLLSLTAHRGGLGWWVRHGPEILSDLRHAGRDFGRSLSEMLDRHFGADETVKAALVPNLAYYHDDPDRLWWTFFAVAQGEYYRHGGYFIRGGSTVLIRALLDVIRAAGGQTRAGRTVHEILLDAEGRAAGVVYRDSHGGLQTARAPIVFAGCAPEQLADMLPADRRAAFLAPYDGKTRSLTLMQASLALTRPAADLGLTAYSTVLVPDWMTGLRDLKDAAALIGDDPRPDRLPPLTVVDYGRIDAGLPGPGPAPVAVAALDRLDNWEGLSDAAYVARKTAWLDALIGRLDREWPGFAQAVRLSDLATARTMAHWMGTPGGAVYGFAPDAPAGMPKPPTKVDTTIPGLFLASAWAGTGGFTGVMVGGKAAADAAL